MASMLLDEEETTITSDDDVSINNSEENKILMAANQLTVPIYILRKTKRLYWKRYSPSACEKDQCRYYVSLLQGKNSFSFYRISPNKGCNCQMAPPVTEQESTIIEVPEVEQHDHMSEHRSEIEARYIERRNLQTFHELDEEYIILLRPDMKNRVLDFVRNDSDSFYACVSKEIFKSETKVDVVRAKIQEKKKSPTRSRNASTSTGTQSISESDYKATVHAFQTKLFILQIEKGESSWTAYETNSSSSENNHAPRNYYMMFFRHSYGRFSRIVPRSEVCNCMMSPPDDPAKQSLLSSQRDRKAILRFQKLSSAFAKVNFAYNGWLSTTDVLIQSTEEMITELELTRRYVSIATIVGSGTGLVGSVLGITGLALIPVSFGASVGLVVAGGVVGGLGGITSVGAAVTETVLTKHRLNLIKELSEIFKQRTKTFAESIEFFQTKAKKGDKFWTEYFQNVDVPGNQLESDIARPIANVIRLSSGLHVIPIMIARVSVRVASTVVGSILAAATIIVDVGLIAQAIYSLVRGSRSAASNNLRNHVSSLKANRIMVKQWADGNITSID